MSNNNYLYTKDEIEEFFKDRKEHLSEHYIHNTRYTLQNLQFQWKQRGVEEITPSVIAETLQTKFVKKTDEFINKPLKRTSLKNLLNRVVVFYIWKLGDTHPFVNDLRKFTKLIKVPDIETMHVSNETINYMLNNLPTNYAFLIWLGCNTSARRTALCNMNVDDLDICKFQDLGRFIEQETFEELMVDWVDEEAAVVKRWDKYGGEHAKQEIEVPLFPNDMPQLLNFLSERYVITEQLGKELKDEKGEFLFWNDRNERMNPASASKFINAFCVKHDIKFTIHHTRHFAIQKWYKLGMRKDTIRKFSGHKSNIIDRYLDIEKTTAFSELAKIQIKRTKEPEICGICKLQIKPSDDTISCKTCKFQFHKNHIENWLTENDICPVCTRLWK